MSLEDVIRENVEEAQDFLAEKLGLNDEEKAKLQSSMPSIELVRDAEPNFYAAYDFKNNVLYFSPFAVRDYGAIAEEVAHSIRLRLNDDARNRLLDQNNKGIAGKIFGIVDYLKLVNMEEMFARYGALLYAAHKGQEHYKDMWSRVDKCTISSYKNRSLRDTLAILSHLYGYKKAENYFKKFGDAKFSRELLYDNKVSDVIKIDKGYLSAPENYRIAA